MTVCKSFEIVRSYAVPKVMGSSPVSPTIKKHRVFLLHLLTEPWVVGSSPTLPTVSKSKNFGR